ncbi:MAG: hypothetical protein K2O78_06420 [Muribaculaceae bacterium]|nr:hypothetical protein [Muribaculaceae bacterium]MDE7081270.1 hypothetical protein [Muribaculaceae bacterium]
MRKEDKLLEKYGRHTGMTVPEGYFEAFSKQMMDKLPAYPEAPRPKKLTGWQRVKPYVYMAAMFAGIWCMMKMFHVASQNAAAVQLDNPPENIVLAMQDADTYDYLYTMPDDMTDFEVETDLSQSYDNIEEFEADFGYQLKPEYASLEIPATAHT